MPSAFDLIYSQLGTLLGQVVDRVAEDWVCAFCEHDAIPVRCRCGNYTCFQHGFFSLYPPRVICGSCAQVLFDHTSPDGAPEAPPAPRRRKRRASRPAPAMDGPEIDNPWELLGVSPEAGAEEINRAFRTAALDCHPDLHVGDSKAAARFNRLQKVREACLKKLRERGGD